MSIGFQWRLSSTVLVWPGVSSLGAQSPGDQLHGGAGQGPGLVRSEEGSLSRSDWLWRRGVWGLVFQEGRYSETRAWSGVTALQPTSSLPPPPSTSPETLPAVWQSSLISCSTTQGTRLWNESFLTHQPPGEILHFYWFLGTYRIILLKARNIRKPITSILQTAFKKSGFPVARTWEGQSPAHGINISMKNQPRILSTLSMLVSSQKLFQSLMLTVVTSEINLGKSEDFWQMTRRGLEWAETLSFVNWVESLQVSQSGQDNWGLFSLLPARTVKSIGIN